MWQSKMDNQDKLVTKCTQIEDKQNNNMHWTLLCANKHN